MFFDISRPLSDSNIGGAPIISVKISMRLNVLLPLLVYIQVVQEL